MKKQMLEWSKALLDDGDYKTQKEWLVWCKDKKLNPKGWRLPTLNEYNELLLSLNKESVFGKEIIADLKSEYLMTADVFIDVNGVAWPVGRDNDYGYNVVGYNYYGRAARGIRICKKH